MTAQAIDRPNVAWCTRAQVIQWEWFADLTTVDPALLDTLCLVASTWLWRQTGRQFSGPASTTVRPVGRCAPYGPSSMGRGPETWFNSRGGTYGYGMDAGRYEGAHEVLLGHTPVRSVDQVVVDGTLLAVDFYRLDDARWLVRTDGQSWPSGNDWTRPSAVGAGGNQQGTWEVTLTWGEDPPPDGVYAAEILAGELALAATGSAACKLPRNVQSVTRQGTSMLMMDPGALLAGGRWGVPEIDYFVTSVNPAGITQPATVTSPDIPRAIRRAGTTPGS